MLKKLTGFIKKITGSAAKDRATEQATNDAADKESTRVAGIQATQNHIKEIQKENGGNFGLSPEDIPEDIKRLAAK
jgi:hypothetical protein